MSPSHDPNAPEPKPSRTPTPGPARVRPRAAKVCFAQTLALVLLGVAPVPDGWAWAELELDYLRSPGPNRADRDRAATGYYEGLIGHGEGGTGEGNELAMRLLRKPTDLGRFSAADVTHPLPDGDFLQFDLKPHVDKLVFGHPFTTNAHGMRDREYPAEKPEGVFRVAVLGSSMDMGWGIAADDTYVRLLEGWLNAGAKARGLARRFEVMNFAVAAYSPLQRLEAFRRKAKGFDPDLVLYSATTLDTRLMEIHLCDVFRAHGEIPYPFLARALSDAGVTDDDTRTAGPDDKLVHKEALKAKLRPYYWPMYDETLGALAAECRSSGVALACLIVPRVGKADAPRARAESVGRLRGIAAHHALPLFDLSGTFDGLDPDAFSLASWDDHPNARGHRRLFQALAREIENDPGLARLVLPGGGDGVRAEGE